MKRNCFITCAGRDDGAGAQIHGVLSTVLYAHENQIKYVHTPFQKISHNYDNDLDWEKNWENFINLGANQLFIDEIDLQDLNIVRFNLNDRIHIEPKEQTLYVVPHCHDGDWDPNKYLKLTSEIYYNFNNSSYKIHSYFDPNKLNIAVHLRRGDVKINNIYFPRYTDNSVYRNIITQIGGIMTEISLDPEIVFHIYSEGSTEEFSDLYNYEKSIILHINESPFTTFHHMVFADILVTSKSSFSYSAALLSRGIKIYIPFWHRSLHDWIVTDKDGNFNKEELKERLMKFSEKIQ